MTLNVGKELAALERMSVGELRERYADLFAETTTARNRKWLIKRILWRMQSLDQGGLSDRARERANELAHPGSHSVLAAHDPRPRRDQRNRRPPDRHRARLAQTTPPVGQTARRTTFGNRSFDVSCVRVPNRTRLLTSKGFLIRERESS